MTPTTDVANTALNEIFELRCVCEQMDGDIRHDENVLARHNQRWPDLKPVSNSAYNDVATRLLGTFQLCRAVDVYNWYCQQIFNLALDVNGQMVTAAPWNQGSIAKRFAKAQRQGGGTASLINDLLSARYIADKDIRDAIHRNLNIMQNPEIELLCTCRNLLVHKLGFDGNGEITDALSKLGKQRAFIGAQGYPDGHMPIAVNSDRFLVMEHSVGNWAAELIQQQIFMMDQNAAHIYKLPCKVWDRKSFSRVFLGDKQR